VFVSGNNELETVLYTLIHDKYNSWLPEDVIV
jgi:hypothetical protein